MPMSRLPDLIRDAKKDYEEAGMVVPILGHVGDGNFHSMLTYYNDEEQERAEKVYKKLIERALALDGTCECAN